MRKLVSSNVKAVVLAIVIVAVLAIIPGFFANVPTINPDERSAGDQPPLPNSRANKNEPPVVPLLQPVNGLDPMDFPPESRCGWYVACGRYVTLSHDPFFGDFLLLEQVGKIPLVTLDRAPVRSMSYQFCHPTKAGTWSAERHLVPGSNAENFVNRVTLDVCRNLLPEINCTFELALSVGVPDARLICDDGRVWILCNSPEERKEMEEYCRDANLETVIANFDQTEFMMGPNDTISFIMTIYSDSSQRGLLIISDAIHEFMYPNWERFLMPPGFSVEGSSQRSLLLIRDQTTKEIITISTNNAAAGTYSLISLVYYQDGRWETAGSTITITVK